MLKESESKKIELLVNYEIITQEFEFSKSFLICHKLKKNFNGKYCFHFIEDEDPFVMVLVEVEDQNYFFKLWCKFKDDQWKITNVGSEPFSRVTFTMFFNKDKMDVLKSANDGEL